MIHPSSAEETQRQPDRPRLEIPILQAFPRAVAEFRAYPVTTAVIVICVINFLLVNLVRGHPGSVIRDILAPSSFLIWSGSVWGLATSAFVHIAFWHILFNMWWARDFGRLLEPHMGMARYVGFVLAAAVASAGWQLLVSSMTGIGLSGVVYAMFGYTLARRGSQPAYQAFLGPRTIAWLFGWLVFCVVLTITKVWSVGNAAHIAGLALGYLIGFAVERSRLRVVAIAGFTVLSIGVVASFGYMPWSPLWRGRHVLGQFDTWRRQAEAGNPRGQAMYGSVLARLPEQRQRGMEWLQQAAQAGDAGGMNGRAWWLATAPEDALRNGGEAVQWAEKAYRLNPGYNACDTLAAAYAEADRWDDAVAMQERALRDLPAERTGDTQAFRDRLEHYKQRQKWREHP